MRKIGLMAVFIPAVLLLTSLPQLNMPSAAVQTSAGGNAVFELLDEPAPAAEAPAQQAPAQPAQQAPAQSSVYYESCADARAAGAAPLYRGQPGYRPGLDRDGDGVACEPKKKH
mgnify:CR=1 FL=1